MSAAEAAAFAQFVVVAALAFRIWARENWARWTLIALIAAIRLYYAPQTWTALQEASPLVVVTTVWLLFDIAVVVFLLTPPVLNWF